VARSEVEKAVCVVLCCRLVPSACCGGSKSLTNLYSSLSLMSDQRNAVDPTLGGGGWMQWIACSPTLTTCVRKNEVIVVDTT
jgi:hypothetical protein